MSATVHPSLADARIELLRERLAALVEELNGETDPACRIELRCQIEELRDARRLLEKR